MFHSFIYMSFSYSICGSVFILQLSNFNSFDGVLYCRHHFDQLFKRTGSLEKSFEGLVTFIIIWILKVLNYKYSTFIESFSA